MGANDFIAKDYSGAAAATTLNGAISGSATTIVLGNGASYPDGSAGKFVICIDRGLVSEEKILITSRSVHTLTVSDRGYDGTGAQSHLNAATVEHVLDAFTIKQANAVAIRLTTGTDGMVLIADAASGSGVKWGGLDGGAP